MTENKDGSNSSTGNSGSKAADGGAGGDLVEQALEQMRPVVQNLGFGAIMGYCAGIAMQKVGKAVAIVVGLAFIALQTAASYGFVQVDWEKIRVSIVKQIDATGDGAITVDDAKAYWRRLKAILTDKVPAAGGFSLGFMYGVRYG